MSKLTRCPLALCLAAILAAPAVASTITVTNCADAGVGSLRDAIAAAVSGDTIDFDASLACSTITLTSGAILIGSGADGEPLADLEIRGPGRDALAIDADYTGRVLDHLGGIDGTLTIAGLAMRHGLTDGDGGCLRTEGSVHLSDVDISECTAGRAVTGAAPSGNARVCGGGVSAAVDVTLVSSRLGDNVAYGGDGYAYGGAVFAGRALTVDSSSIRVNIATSNYGGAFGGAVAVGDRSAPAQGSLSLTSSDLQNNTAFSGCDVCAVRGGGAFVYGNSQFEASVVSGNTAFSLGNYGAGGALYFNALHDGAPVSATLTDTDLGSNSAGENGGAIAAAGDLSIVRGTLSGNSGQSGGAIVQLSGTLTLTDSLLTGNVATADGAGIFIFGYGNVSVVDSTISENIAMGHGGALANSYGSVHFSNSTVTGNSANEVGGGIWFDYPYYTLALDSTIVAGNTVGGDADDIFAPGGTAGGSHNLIVAAPGLEVPPDTISDDPQLLALADNGGPTMTHALAEGSPAIDVGSNPLELPFDQRGAGFVRVYGSAADIGAFEVQPDKPGDRIFANGFGP